MAECGFVAMVLAAVFSGWLSNKSYKELMACLDRSMSMIDELIAQNERQSARIHELIGENDRLKSEANQ